MNESNASGVAGTATANSTGVDGDGSAPSHRVLEAVSEARDVDVLDLPPLYDTVDPDALDVLFADRPGDAGARSGTLAFEYADSTVVLDGDGTVTVL